MSQKKEDFCDRCLEDAEEVLGEEQRVLNRGGNYVTYIYKCPKCSHSWYCTFYED